MRVLCKVGLIYPVLFCDYCDWYSFVSVLHGLFNFSAIAFMNPTISDVCSKNQIVEPFSYTLGINATELFYSRLAVFSGAIYACTCKQELITFKYNRRCWFVYWK